MKQQQLDLNAVAAFAAVVTTKQDSSAVDPEELCQSQRVRRRWKRDGLNIESLEALRLMGADVEERR